MALAALLSTAPDHSGLLDELKRRLFAYVLSVPLLQ